MAKKELTCKEFIDYLTYASIGIALEDLSERAHSLHEKIAEYSDILSKFEHQFDELDDDMSNVCIDINNMIHSHEHDPKGERYDEILSCVQEECEEATVKEQEEEK